MVGEEVLHILQAYTAEVESHRMVGASLFCRVLSYIGIGEDAFEILFEVEGVVGFEDGHEEGFTESPGSEKHQVSLGEGFERLYEVGLVHEVVVLLFEEFEIADTVGYFPLHFVPPLSGGFGILYCNLL